MNWLRFGTLSIGSFTTSVLLAVITGYLISLKKKTQDAWYLTGYIGVLCLLLLSYTFRYSVFDPLSMSTGQISNLIVFGNVCLIQFAYRYGEHTHIRESRIVLIVTGLASLAVWGSLFVMKNTPQVYDFAAQYYTFEFGPRIAILTFLGYLWTIFVFERKVHRLSRAIESTKNTLRLSYRSFSLLTAATAVVSLSYLLFQIDIISRAWYSVIFNSGSPIICLAIFIVYINNSTRPVSVEIKLVAIPLAVVLVTLSISASVLMPVVHENLADRFYAEADRIWMATGEGGLQDGTAGRVFIVERDADDASGTATRAEGLLPEREGRKPEFFYTNFVEPESFFFSIDLQHLGAHYSAVFPYDMYLFQVHRVSIRFILVALASAILIVAGLPYAYRRGLLKPLAALLEGVTQVSSGNYRMHIPVRSGDEVGQLGRGYNDMIKSLENAEGNFKALAENARDAILIISSEGDILFANRMAEELSGHPVHVLSGKQYSFFIHPDDINLVNRRFSERMHDAGRRDPYEIRVKHSDSHSIPVEITGGITQWQGEAADVVIIRDITERKRTEELLQTQQLSLMRADKLSTLGALVAGVAHEVNNPNQVVSMNARFLADGIPPLLDLAESGEPADDSIRLAGLQFGEFKHSASSAVREIVASTRRIDHIVNELKNYVRGGSKRELQQVDVNQVITTVAALSRHMISSSTRSFTLNLEDGLPTILADQSGLEQVILNLLQNACQALENRDQGVTIRTGLEATGREISIRVCDEGRGISADELERITASFFTTKSEQGGTGLGLSVSTRIVRELNGSLEFKSDIGEGTEAIVRLPVS